MDSNGTNSTLQGSPKQQAYYREASYTLVYMSICLTCVIWQVINASMLIRRSRKVLHVAVLCETLLAFFVILVSLLNPLADVSCEFRYWVSIVAVNLGGCCIQSILLYKAWICYDRAKWLICFGSLISIGYIALIFLYATLGKVPTWKDVMGNCVLHNLEWPALAKLGLDILSNVFLSVAFLMVIYRHYRMFNNSLHRSLLSGGIIFSVGVIASNIATGILISCRVMGGLSADLYAFDWVITGYLLIKQFKMDRREDNEDDAVSKTMHSDSGSILSHHRDNQVGVLSSFDMLNNGSNLCQICGISLVHVNNSRNDVEAHHNNLIKASY